MNYFKRQFNLWYFMRKVVRIFDDPQLANNYLSRNQLYRKVVWDYFAKNNPLENKENKSAFPWGTNEFIKSQKNGHNLESMENNLDFLQKEYDSYFEELLGRGIIKANDDIPPQYFLNRNSPMVYWELGILNLTKIIWEFISIFKGK